MTDQIIIDSIKKLISLKMKDDEIIGSLLDAGVDYDYAKKMLDYVKYHKEKPVDKQEITVAKPLIQDVSKQQKETPKESELNKVDKSSLDVWQQGILTLINQKLDDINEKTKKLDNMIEERVQSITSAETKKMKVMLDSQRALLIAKINMSLENKSKEIETKTNNQLQLIQEINKETQEKLKDLEKGTDKLQELETSVTNMLGEFTKMRDNSKEIIDQMTNDFKTQFDKLLKEYQNKFNDVDLKLNSALNLATKIIESLVNSTKKKLDNYYDEKAETAIKGLKEKLETELSSSKVDEILKKLEKKEAELTNVLDEKISSALENIDLQKYDKSILDLNKRLAELNKRINLKSGSGDKIEELEDFKEQYAKLIVKVQKDIKQLKAKVK